MRESSRGADTSLSRALELARAALEPTPAGLLTDFDGTISPIVRDPSSARLVDGADRALATLARRLAVVAIVTGRAPLDARTLVGMPDLLIAGNHGMEWLEPGASRATTSPAAESIAGGLGAALARLPELPGVVPEHKGISASIHYRQAPEPDIARDAIVAALGDVEPLGLRVGHGRMIVEVRPIGLGDKGSAARSIVSRYGLRGVVVLGDDVTDLDMFRAVAELRSSGSLRAAIIAVGGADHDVLPEVAAAADALLSSPADAAGLLAQLAGDQKPAT